MAYTWITPKTDWTASTYFTYTDYNRIRNNLLYINDKLNQMYPEKAVTLDLGNPKTGYDNNYYPSEFNAFEDALISFNRVGESANIGDKKVYKPNTPFILYTDLNRIEACCLRWKNYEPPINSVSVEPTYINFGVGDTQQLSIITDPSNKPYTVTYISSNTTSATVDSNGLVTGVSEGSFTIIAVVNCGGKTFNLTVDGRISGGSYFFFNNQKYFYDLIVVGLTKNNYTNSRSAMLLMPRYRTSALEGKWGARTSLDEKWNDEFADYRANILNFMETNFSTQLKNSLVEFYLPHLISIENNYYKDGCLVTYQSDSPSSGSGYKSSTYLPTTSFYGLPPSTNADPADVNLYDFVSISGVEKKEFTEDLINGEPLISGTDRGQLIQVRLNNGNDYSMARLLNNKVYSAGVNEVLPLRPIFGGLSGTHLKVHPNPNSEGIYIIDWNLSPDSIPIGILPLGAIIRDDSGIGRTG